MPLPVDVLIKLVAAAVMGGVVGWQREVRERPAGLRTHVLVSVGACVYTLASVAFGALHSDPARVAAQVATGMGFLGAGTIIRHGNVVRGLTTAASLWAVAAIGVCAGLGGQTYWVAGIATVLVLVTLTVLQRVEHRLGVHGLPATPSLRLVGGAEQIARVQEALRGKGVQVESFDVRQVGPAGVYEMRLGLRLPAGCDLPAMTVELSGLPGFTSLRCE